MRAAMSVFAVVSSVSANSSKLPGRTSSRLNTSSPVRTVSNNSHRHCGDTSGRCASQCSITGNREQVVRCGRLDVLPQPIGLEPLAETPPRGLFFQQEELIGIHGPDRPRQRC